MRRRRVLGHPTLNGIDYLEVAEPPGYAPSREGPVLLLYFLNALDEQDESDLQGQVHVFGPPRATVVAVESLQRASTLTGPGWEAFFSGNPDRDRLLVVQLQREGDRSRYRLVLTSNREIAKPRPPFGFDPQLAELEFGFGVARVAAFDCKDVELCPDEPLLPEPHIDYLSRDFDSLRQLLLDRMAAVMPSWTERSPADIQITLVELLAYVGDYLSYYQDAVATESNLTTARRRISIARHARLLDYRMHQGCNARTWVAAEIECSRGYYQVPKGARFMTTPEGWPRTNDENRRRLTPIPASRFGEAVDAGTHVFEAMHPTTLRPSENRIEFYTWGEARCCLPSGATEATLLNHRGGLNHLCAGDVLLFEEVLDPETGGAHTDTRHRHVVRLLQNPEFLEDPTTGIFQRTGDMISARSGHAAGWLGALGVAQAGGINERGIFGADAERYDATQAEFAAMDPMGTERVDHTATSLTVDDTHPESEILVIGGRNSQGDPLETAEFWSDGTWRSTEMRMRFGRKRHTATLLLDGRVLVVGGEGNCVEEPGPEIFDRDTERFTLLETSPLRRERHAAVRLAEELDSGHDDYPYGAVLIVGGMDLLGNPTRDISLFDPESETFSTIGLLEDARADHTASLLEDGRVLVVGGQGESALPIASAEIISFGTDPLTVASGEIEALTHPRSDHTASVLPDLKILIAGGLGTDGEPVAEAELFDPEAIRFQVTGSMIERRARHTAFALADGTILLAGGSDTEGALQSAEIFEPPVDVARIQWHEDDGLPFALPLWNAPKSPASTAGDPSCEEDEATGESDADDANDSSVPASAQVGEEDTPRPVSLARGNLILVDHGRTVDYRDDSLSPECVEEIGEYRPRLMRRNASHTSGYSHSEARTKPARDAVVQDPREALAHVKLRSHRKQGDRDINASSNWEVVDHLLDSDRFASEFLVEVDDDFHGTLRFGDNINGLRPAAGEHFSARYRIGNGEVGNLGADALSHVVFDATKASATGIEADKSWDDWNNGYPCTFTRIRNPLHALGGQEREEKEDVRRYAPDAFRGQERAVNVDDYAEVAERHEEVLKAMATLRWTGSWYTVFITVDRSNGQLIDPAFRLRLVEFFEDFRMMGYDVEIDGPRFVPLDISLTVQVEEGHLRSAIKRELVARLGHRELPGTGRGFFHPDNFTFGQPVYLSQLLHTVTRVDGVDWVDVTGFSRLGETSEKPVAEGFIAMNRLEIAQLELDANTTSGRLRFEMRGGL